jgi:chromosome segregation ATPase
MREFFKERRSTVERKLKALEQKRRELSEKQKQLQKEKLALVQDEQRIRTSRRRLLSKLLEVYPIDLQKMTITGLHLPNPEEILGKKDPFPSIQQKDEINAALGIVAYVVFVAARILQVPLCFEIRPCGSKTKIVDHVTHGTVQT